MFCSQYAGLSKRFSVDGESQKVDGTGGRFPLFFRFWPRIVAGESMKVAGNIAGHRHFLTTLILIPIVFPIMLTAC